MGQVVEQVKLATRCGERDWRWGTRPLVCEVRPGGAHLPSHRWASVSWIGAAAFSLLP